MVRTLFCLLLVTAPAAAQPLNGFPNWEERVLHQWINRARVEPATELAGCGSNCSTAEMQPSCYTSIAPLMWDYELAVAARFHGESMAKQSFFGHNTPCALRSDIRDLYPATCDGSTACSCAGSGGTSPSTRVNLFGGSYQGEIIAAGYSNPVSAFYGWLHESASSAPCGFTTANGHRWLILKATNSMGAGYATGGSWGRYYTTDFGRGGAVTQIPSGAHYPRQASTIEFWANWYDDEGPSAASVVIGTTSHSMRLERGSATSGAWTTSVNGLGSGCHRYHFEFVDSGGQTVRYPSSGTFGIGPVATCADWVDAVIPPPTLAAEAVSTIEVQVSWTTSPGASQYELQRAASNLSFVPVATVSGNSYADTVLRDETYVYRIRPIGGETWSNLDHVTTFGFTDDPVIANVTSIRSLHLTELRTAINTLRDVAGLSLLSSWTDASPFGATVKAAHIQELRTALTAALTALGKNIAFANPVSAGAPPRAVDFQELRDALK